jgi:hypothetical protein
MKCKICQQETKKLFSHEILKKYSANFYHCDSCHFVQTNPYWLEEAYSSAICAQDNGIMVRNLDLVRKSILVLFYLFQKDKKFLDYAGGYGIFTRMMRDIGFDFYWEDKFCSNLVARGFEGRDKNYELITSFESFEHFEDPMAEIQYMLNKSDNILFTTELMPSHEVPDQKWWYYCFNTGQHICFYSQKTMEIIAKKFGLNFYSNGLLHLFSKEKLSLKYKDRFLSRHLLKLKIASFLSNTKNNNDLFKKILLIEKDRTRKISNKLGTRLYSDFQQILENG